MAKRIQWITEAPSYMDEYKNVTYSGFGNPRSLDEFDINVIDLSDSSLWKNRGQYADRIDKYNDLCSISEMVKHSTKSITVYVLPQNECYVYNYHSCEKSRMLKDTLKELTGEMLSSLLPQLKLWGLVFENTRTEINGREYVADFYFCKPYKTVLTTSKRSEKATTLEIVAGKEYITTLKIGTDIDSLLHYLDYLFGEQERAQQPEWFNSIEFGDDREQQRIICECQQSIEEANRRIGISKAKLEENNRIKSILYTNGDELVQVIYKILEEILKCDLSQFVDVKKEDFLIKSDPFVFIGEIKGITSNVKYEHISQLELHYRSYLDNLPIDEKEDQVKQILIINPFRTKPLEEREPIHSAQIELAERYGCLIVETHVLLRIYEKFCMGQITAEQCIEIFSKTVGVLSLEHFE